MTAQLLLFSRRDRSAPALLDVDALLREIGRMLPPLLGEQIVLSVDSEPGLWVSADATQLQHVLINLAVNARDALADGGRLSITSERALLNGHEDTPPGCFVRIAVADEGCGMPPEVQARVFEPFFTTKGKGQGTGLGLATAYGVITKAGGRIEIDSRVGEGTTVHVLLPCAEPGGES